MHKTLISIFFGLVSFQISAQVTFSKDIASLIYNNCSNCHRPGEIGPFPLTNYDEISGQAEMIKYVTSIGYMPPWKPDPNYSSFLGESILTPDEISMIADWVDNGMPRGDEALEPAFPDYPSGSLLGEPDLVLEMTEAHLHKGNNRDSYYYFVLPTGLLEDKIIKTMEFRPGNAEIVHHALIFEDVNGIAAATDASTPEYGFESFGSFNGDNNDITFLEGKQFPPYAPGQKAVRYPEGLGQVLKAGADLAVQIHYAPVASDEWDQSKINIFFADESEKVERFVDQDIFLPNRLPGGFFSFFIQPNEVKEFVGTYRISSDQSIMGIFPHSHLLGTDWEAWVEHTDGSTTNLISIPEWDFNWQSQYYFDRFIKAEAGSVIYAKANYDNTANNPFNPNDPPAFVAWGDRTEDEMFYMPFLFVPYQEGDEDIRFDDGAVSVKAPLLETESKLFALTPNPVRERMHLEFYLAKGQPMNISIYDLNGQLVRRLRKQEFFSTGLHSIDFLTTSLNSGMYFIRLEGEGVDLTSQFVKT